MPQSKGAEENKEKFGIRKTEATIHIEEEAVIVHNATPGPSRQ